MRNSSDNFSSICLASIILLSTLFSWPLPSACAIEGGGANLLEMNQTFRDFYHISKQELRTRLGPVIIASKGHLVLLKDGKRTEYPYISDEWQLLKTVDHASLAIFVALVNHTGEKLPDEVVTRLNKLRTQIIASKDDVKSFSFSSFPGQRKNSAPFISPERTSARQLAILDRCAKFLDGVLAERHVSYPDLHRFERDIAADTMENVFEAAAFELYAIDLKMQEWRKQLGKEEWERLYIVVTGSHMARIKERSMQYFLQLMGQKEEGDRVVYQEGNDDEEKALDLLVVHILDSKIALAYFDDKTRMHRDILSDAAAKYLRLHPAH